MVELKSIVWRKLYERRHKAQIMSELCHRLTTDLCLNVFVPGDTLWCRFSSKSECTGEMLEFGRVEHFCEGNNVNKVN